MGRLLDTKFCFDQETLIIHESIKKSLATDFVPNLFKEISHSKTSLLGLKGMYQKLLTEGLIPRSMKELILLAIALDKQCLYCTSIHLASSDQFSPDEAKIILNDISKIKNNLTRESIIFALKVVKDPKGLSPKEYNVLTSLGLNLNEILEIVALASLANSSINIAQFCQIKVENEIDSYLTNNELSVNVKG